jgi:hypothetical protein
VDCRSPISGARPHTGTKFARGVAFFSVGLAKKVLLANPCGKIADLAFDAGSLTVLDAWYGVTAYAFQIYFDFSGYSDMAIGLGLMLGFVFPKNFDSPYISQSITEFWRRWHISLSTWLRDYLYVPIGGNRKGPVRPYANLFIVLLLGGLWNCTPARSPGISRYLLTDTHWRPETTQHVAERLALFVLEHVDLPSGVTRRYESHRLEAQQTGDTTAMRDLPEGQRFYPPERVTLRYIVDAGGTPWRSSRDADVLLLGDSFTNCYSRGTMGWGEAAGLAGQLSYALQRPVVAWCRTIKAPTPRACWRGTRRGLPARAS